MSGALFETFIINEIIKSYSNNGTSYDFSIFYYRGKDKKKRKINMDGKKIETTLEGEIDLIIQEGNTLYPIEIKETSNPKESMANEFDVLDLDKSKIRGLGVIISTYNEKIELRKNLISIPIEYI